MVNGEGKVGLIGEQLFKDDKVGPFADDKSVTTTADASTQIPLACPDCKSLKIFRNGKTTSEFGVKIQRYLCRDCGRRFSDPVDMIKAKQTAENYLLSISSEPLNCQSRNTESVQVGDKQIEGKVSKNLIEAQKQELCVSQKVKLDDHGIDIVIADYKQYIQVEHKTNDLTLSKYVSRLKRLAAEFKINLFDPEDFKRKLAFDPVMSTWTNGNKNGYCKAYTSFVKHYLHINDVKIPHFEYRTPEYILPLPNHMEMLYAKLSVQMQVFCFVLMATAARPIEALRIEWKDIDFVRNTIAINHPAKHGRTRTVQLKGNFVKVIGMLAEWKKTQFNIATSPNGTIRQNRKQRNVDRIFTYRDTDVAGNSFRRARKRAAKALGMPELEKITFYSNRHWRAVLERYLKGNSDAVANLLGENSDKYVKVYAPISERIYGSDKQWEQPVEICEIDPDYSEKMNRLGLEGYLEYNYNRTTGRHYLRKEKNTY
ncbi:MAG: tyrosine-type recombinase/integrase [Candidatus Bathyarchaeota archaeon]|nr:tyrosine-type recombinase/integrase [Candidatus Bathyarchaeota archaeon]